LSPSPELLLFPNPSTGTFTAFSPSQSLGKITIYDLTGNIVYEISNVPNQSYEFNLDALSKGVYQVKAENELGIFVSRLVIQ
jgi:hypothetical protein